METENNSSRQLEYQSIKHPVISNLHVQIVDLQYCCVHTHSDIEILQILSGGLHVKTSHEEYDLTTGDVAIFSRNLSHGCQSSDSMPCCALVVQIDTSFCASYFPNASNIVFEKSNLSDILTTPEQLSILDEIKHICFDLAYNFFVQKIGFEFRCISDLNRLFSYFLVNLPIHMLTDAEYYASLQAEQRMKRILSYIHRHYTEKITLTDIATHENLSVPYLSQMFHQHLNQTFQDYVKNLRFEHAIYLLQKSNLKIYDICIESGFSDPKYLNKMFHDIYHTTPAAFRKQLTAGPHKQQHMVLDNHQEIYSVTESIETLRSFHEYHCDHVPFLTALE